MPGQGDIRPHHSGFQDQTGGLALGGDWVQARYGLHLPLSAPSGHEWTLLAATLGAALLLGLLPAARAYRQSLADGLSVRL